MLSAMGLFGKMRSARRTPHVRADALNNGICTVQASFGPLMPEWL